MPIRRVGASIPLLSESLAGSSGSKAAVGYRPPQAGKFGYCLQVLSVSPWPQQVIQPVEMPARKRPFTRLTKIVVAELPAADSYTYAKTR